MDTPVVGVDLASGPDFVVRSVWSCASPDEVSRASIADLAGMIEDASRCFAPDVLFVGPTGARMYRYATSGRYHTDRRGRTWRKGPRF